MSKLGEEMVAINLGRRYGIPTVALRYSIVQGPRQSVYNAYSGACRIFCLSYLLGQAPTLYEDGGAIRDYVNIDDVVDANLLVLTDERAAGRVFNVGGGRAVTTREFADVVMRQYGSREPGMVTGEYRFGDTRHILSDISALRELGWEPRSTPADSVAAYAEWLKGIDDLDGVLAEANARMRALGVVRRTQNMKAFLLAAGVGSRLRPITDTIPKCMVPIDGQPMLDIWLDAFDRAGVDEVLVNLHHLPDVVRHHLEARTGTAGRAHLLRTGAARQRGHARRQPGLDRRRRDVPGLLCRQPDRFRSELAGPGAPGAWRDRDADGLSFRTALRWRRRGSRRDRHHRRLRRRSRANPVSDLVNAGMYAFHPNVLDEIGRSPAARHRL